MIINDPVTPKILTLLVTRLLLLAGAILAWNRTSVPVRLLLVLGSASLVLSGTIALCAISPAISVPTIPGIMTIAEVAEVGGWVSFSVGFLAIILAKRMKSQNQPSQPIAGKPGSG